LPEGVVDHFVMDVLGVVPDHVRRRPVPLAGVQSQLRPVVIGLQTQPGNVLTRMGLDFCGAREPPPVVIVAEHAAGRSLPERPSYLPGRDHQPVATGQEKACALKPDLNPAVGLRGGNYGKHPIDDPVAHLRKSVSSARTLRFACLPVRKSPR
jgi:hypothetical protein